MTRDEAQQPPVLADAATLPPVVDVPTAGQWLGIGRTTAYQLAKAGLFPVPVLRIGVRLRVPIAPLIRLLELDDTAHCAGPDRHHSAAPVPGSIGNAGCVGS